METKTGRHCSETLVNRGTLYLLEAQVHMASRSWEEDEEEENDDYYYDYDERPSEQRSSQYDE